MINAKKLIKLARKWHNITAIRRKRITLPQCISDSDTRNCSSSSRIENKVYSIDQRRFVLPLAYLNREIVGEPLNLAEEEFGTSNNGHIIFPFDGVFMEYVIKLIKQNVCNEVEQSFVDVYSKQSMFIVIVSPSKSTITNL